MNAPSRTPWRGLIAALMVAVPLLSGCSPVPPGNAASPALLAAPGRLSGELISVQDGDTFRFRLAGGQVVRVRIGGIDAPEHGQPFADLSRARLDALLHAGPIRLDAYKTDPFGRYVANVYVGDADVGLVLINDGLAWHFKRYAREQTPDQREAYARGEIQARRRGLGLWGGERPLEPWEFRRQASKPG